jgi:hypothetical protein
MSDARVSHGSAAVPAATRPPARRRRLRPRTHLPRVALDELDGAQDLVHALHARVGGLRDGLAQLGDGEPQRVLRGDDKQDQPQARQRRPPNEPDEHRKDGERLHRRGPQVVDGGARLLQLGAVGRHERHDVDGLRRRVAVLAQRLLVDHGRQRGAHAGAHARRQRVGLLQRHGQRHARDKERDRHHPARKVGRRLAHPRQQVAHKKGGACGEGRGVGS